MYKRTLTTSVDCTISSDNWSTLMLPFNAEIPSNMNVYSCNSYSDELLKLDEEAQIKANTPYLIFAEPDTYNFIGLGSAWEDTYDNGWFTGVYVNTINGHL